MQRVDPGDTAWMLLCTVLVLLMTIPGLALFYAGMVRKKNVLAIMMQSFSLCAAMTVVWIVAGYSLAFTNGNAWIGDTSRLFLRGVAIDWAKPFTLGAGTGMAQPTTIPESVFIMFQMAFAIITPAVITGSCADRMKFSALMLFMTLWSLLVYAPLAHWVWAPTGWLAALGVADFAGGTVVEINCGITGLVCAVMLGRRIGLGQENMAPWNLSYAVVGASLLWVGWMGFNAGGALGANGRAGMAVLVTQVAAAGATLSWTFAEWFLHGKPSVLGAISGAVAGLVTITPAAGFVLPGPALAIGLVAGAVCFWAATSLKLALRYDDSLDAFGVHGVGGIIGMLATGWFAYGPLTATRAQPEGIIIGGLGQLGVQAAAILVTILWSAGTSWILLTLVDRTLGLRVTAEEEREGLDIVLHGEQVF
ncbi:ammonium transporter [Rhodopila sp.]|jgi:Amt family ammonium transporter|uniref:ammonium transporter n=1 Tax=Rhodopila sp. TaxID=2480087 RepID=UPI002C976C1D|nr:ammonium transporter [Rhodopila sp.]HVZ07991.1 ammonium transporter [Rhodopila sp.]